ncbi:MAG: hypothetical protein MH472_07430 [Bacteroidia bacterium]|nr:hypothetical protein [Bacteroidia bacterium]
MKHSYTPGDIVIGKFKYTDKDDFKVRNFLIIATPHPFVWGLMMSELQY